MLLLKTSGLRQGQHNAEEDLKLAAAVDAAGLDDGGGERFKELHEQDHIHGVGAVGKPQGNEGIAQAQLLNVHEQGHDADGGGHEQGEHDQPLHHTVALGLEDAQAIAQQAVEDQGADHAAHHGDKGIEIVLGDAQLIPGVYEGLKIKGLGQDAGAGHEFLQILEARQDDPYQGEQGDDHHDPAQEQDEAVSDLDRGRMHIIFADHAGALRIAHLRSSSFLSPNRIPCG